MCLIIYLILEQRPVGDVLVFHLQLRPIRNIRTYYSCILRPTHTPHTHAHPSPHTRAHPLPTHTPLVVYVSDHYNLHRPIHMSQQLEFNRGLPVSRSS